MLYTIDKIKEEQRKGKVKTMKYRVVDNKTNEVKTTGNTTLTQWYAVDMSRLRSKYTDCTVEWYYGKIDGHPTSTIQTFH